MSQVEALKTNVSELRAKLAAAEKRWSEASKRADDLAGLNTARQVEAWAQAKDAEKRAHAMVVDLTKQLREAQRPYIVELEALVKKANPSNLDHHLGVLRSDAEALVGVTYQSDEDAQIHVLERELKDKKDDD